MSIYSLIATLSIFIFQIVGTHLLSPTDYGIFSKWLTDLSYVSIFFTLGLDTSLLYFAKLGNDIEKNIGKNIIIYSVIFLVCILAITLLPIEKVYYYSLTLNVYLFSLNGVFLAYFQYYEKFKIYNTLSTIRPVLLLTIFTSIFFFRSNLISVSLTFILYSIGVLFAFIYSFTILFKYVKISFNKIQLFEGSYFKYGIKSIINKVLSFLLYASCIYVLTYKSGYKSVAYFFVASSISKMVWVIPDSAGNLLYPKFLKIRTNYDDNEAIAAMSFYSQIVFLINMAFFILFYFFGRFFLNVFYEKSYIIAFLPTLILLFGNQGMVYYKLISRYLAAKNEWKPLYYSLIVAIATNIGLNFLLIPLYGVIGAALASCFSFWVCGLYVSFYVKRSLLSFINIYAPIIYFIKYLREKYF